MRLVTNVGIELHAWGQSTTSRGSKGCVAAGADVWCYTFGGSWGVAAAVPDASPAHAINALYTDIYSSLPATSWTGRVLGIGGITAAVMRWQRRP